MVSVRLSRYLGGSVEIDGKVDLCGEPAHNELYERCSTGALRNNAGRRDLSLAKKPHRIYLISFGTRNRSAQ